MTSLLKRALAEVESLSAEDQDALASRWLAEIEEERRWAASFAATTDDQWDKMIADVHQDVAARGTRSLDDVFPPEDPSR